MYKRAAPVFRRAGVDELLGAGDKVAARLAHGRELLAREGLLVHVVILAHGPAAKRLPTTLGLLRLLGESFDTKNAKVWLSVQGSVRDWFEVAELQAPDCGLIASNSANLVGMHRVAAAGKTENVLGALAHLVAISDRPLEDQYVVFIDNDYKVYDAINAWALIVPWLDVVADCGDRELITKAGGGRIALPEDMLSYDVTQVPLSYNALLKHMVDLGLETRGWESRRTSKALTHFLSALPQDPVADFLARFSFILHGDQGAPLSTWAKLPLAPGYGLELSFLASAMAAGVSTAWDVVTLPHMHERKDDTANSALGQELFTLLFGLLGVRTNAQPQPPEALLYPPLSEMLTGPMARADIGR